MDQLQVHLTDQGLLAVTVREGAENCKFLNLSVTREQAQRMLAEVEYVREVGPGSWCQCLCKYG